MSPVRLLDRNRLARASMFIDPLSGAWPSLQRRLKCANRSTGPQRSGVIEEAYALMVYPYPRTYF
jgi:hypothetical protein